MKEFIFPKKIKLQKKVESAENLYLKKDKQIGLSETKTTNFSKDSCIILDFEKEMNGGIRILTFLADFVKVRIRFGESLTECCSEIADEKNATNDHSLRDFTVELMNYSDMSFGNTGFRFVRLDFYGNAIIKSIIAINEIFKKKTIYTYKKDDVLIKNIFDTAKRTVDLCAGSGYLWDGIKRDRLVWIGDIHPEMLALTTLYGKMPLLEKSLDFVKKQSPLPNWMNGYPMYSMWWIIIVADYFESTNSIDFTKKQLNYMSDLVQQMYSCVLDSGELNYPSYFVDWPTKDKPDEIHGVRAINIMATKKAIFVLKTFNKSTDIAEKLLEKLLKVEINATTSKQVIGLKYFAVGLNEKDKATLIENGAEAMSTFMSYYILKAVASFDRQKAIQMLKDYYGAMLDKGATTFWEDFDLSWTINSNKIDEFPTAGQKDIHGDFGAYCYKGFRHSLCHGWAAGIIAFIKEEC